MVFIGKILKQPSLGRGNYSVISADYPSLHSYHVHTSYPPPDCQEGAHDIDAFSVARQDPHALLQVSTSRFQAFTELNPFAQISSLQHRDILLCGDSSSADHFDQSQERHRRRWNLDNCRD